MSAIRRNRKVPRLRHSSFLRTSSVVITTRQLSQVPRPLNPDPIQIHASLHQYHHQAQINLFKVVLKSLKLELETLVRSGLRGPGRTSRTRRTYTGGTDNTYTTTVTISNITAHDFTEYTCEFDVSMTTTLTSDEMSLKEVEIYSVSQSRYVSSGEAVTLTCAATLVASSSVAVTWRKDGQEISGAVSGVSGLEIPRTGVLYLNIEPLETFQHYFKQINLILRLVRPRISGGRCRN
eukprot:sb/3469223/